MSPVRACLDGVVAHETARIGSASTSRIGLFAGAVIIVARC